jgi:hypothetical protein
MDTATSRNMSDDEFESCLKAEPGSSGHNLSPTDPDSPMTWPFFKKVYVSAVSFVFVFVV